MLILYHSQTTVRKGVDTTVVYKTYENEKEKNTPIKLYKSPFKISVWHKQHKFKSSLWLWWYMLMRQHSKQLKCKIVCKESSWRIQIEIVSRIPFFLRKSNLNFQVKLKQCPIATMLLSATFHRTCTTP